MSKSSLGNFTIPLPGEEDDSEFDFTQLSSSKISDSIQNEDKSPEQKQKSFPKPLRFEEFQQETKEILGFVDMFDGLQLSYQRAVTPQFSISHSFSLGSQVEDPSYNLMTTFGTGKTHLMGRVDTNGVVMGRLLYNPIKELLLKSTVQVAGGNSPSAMLVEGEYYGNDFLAEAKLGSTIIGASFTQRVTKKLSLGVEMAYTHAQGISVIRGAFRHQTDKTISTALIDNTGQFNCSFVHKINDKADLATELVIVLTPKGWESVTAIGYSFRLDSANVRGSFDSHGRITTIFEEKINPAMDLILSGEIDYLRGQSRFGIGFNMRL